MPLDLTKLRFATQADLNRYMAKTQGDRPEFTPEEMKWLESLPKKQRKQAILQLKQKHYQNTSTDK